MQNAEFVQKSKLTEIAVGKRCDDIDELPFQWIGQGYGYKSPEAYESGYDYVCYIPEYCCDEETKELDIDCCYTKADFEEITNGDKELARRLFDAVDWQHPSSLWNEGVDE